MVIDFKHCLQRQKINHEVFCITPLALLVFGIGHGSGFWTELVSFLVPVHCDLLHGVLGETWSVLHSDMLLCQEFNLHAQWKPHLCMMAKWS